MYGSKGDSYSTNTCLEASQIMEEAESGSWLAVFYGRNSTLLRRGIVKRFSPEEERMAESTWNRLGLTHFLSSCIANWEEVAELGVWENVHL